MEKEKNAKNRRWERRGVFALLSRESNSDVLGSYTGTPKDGGQPTQDADDL